MEFSLSTGDETRNHYVDKQRAGNGTEEETNSERMKERRTTFGGPAVIRSGLPGVKHADVSLYLKHVLI